MTRALIRIAAGVSFVLSGWALVLDATGAQARGESLEGVWHGTYTTSESGGDSLSGTMSADHWSGMWAARRGPQPGSDGAPPPARLASPHQ